MRGLHVSLLIAFALLAFPRAHSQSPPPAALNPLLSAQINGVNDETLRVKLPLADLKIDVHVVGAIARTTIHATFTNPTEQWTEGTLALALPEDAIVTGYALDIEGRMIDGVLTEPSRARAAYTQQVRKTIDPGIAEVSADNVFVTRVYPITEKGRRIRASFVAPIHADSGWRLPLATEANVGRVTITVRVEGVKTMPEVAFPAGLQAQWTREGDVSVAKISAAKLKLSGELRFGPVPPAAGLLVTTHSSGKQFFQILDEVPAQPASATAQKRVRIYWDRSLSRKDDALRAEIDLVDRYLAAVKPGAVDLVLFNSTGATVRSFPDPDRAAVTSALRATQYRGGTSFAVLQNAKVPDASVCLLFSDGIGTIDRRDTFKPACELKAVANAPDADIGYLARLMQRASSDVIRLTSESTERALAQLSRESSSIVEVRDATSGAALPYALLRTSRDRVAAVGNLPAGTREVVVRMAGGSKPIPDRRYPVTAAPVRFDGAGALWAADEVMQLAATERWKDLRTVSRRFNVANPHMSFVVLENAWNYVEWNITPPSGFSKKWWSEYREVKADAEEEHKEKHERRLPDVIQRWRDQQEWWSSPFDPNSPAAERKRTYGRGGYGSCDGDTCLQEIITTGMRVRGEEIQLPPWNIKRPYIAALDAASKAQLDRVLASQEKRHGTVPAFYLDVSEWFHRRGDATRALELLLSSLELPSTSDETSLVVASRLVRYGQLDRAISLYERHIRLMPDRPQPIRALALALAERAKKESAAAARRDLKRAITLLNQIITTPWDEAHDGIEMISLMEVNQLIPRLQTLGVANTIVDPRLVASLDVDLRVLIEWNTAATDLDLWVQEPNGEDAMYGNPKTAIGGRLSNDMTSGYGPEEYLLRRAPDGRFELSVNVYASDQLNPNGKTTVSAHLTHHFGRPDERTERLDLELSRNDSGHVPLGAFVLGKAASALTATPRDPDDEEDEEDEDDDD